MSSNRVTTDVNSVILEIRTKHLSLSHFLQCFSLTTRKMILPLSSQLKCKGICHFICLNVSLIGCFLQILWYKATNYMLKWELATHNYSRFTSADLLRKMFSPSFGRNTAFLIQGRFAEADVMTVLPSEFSLNKMDLTEFFVPLKIYCLKVMKANPVHFHCVHLFFASVKAGRGVNKRYK